MPSREQQGAQCLDERRLPDPGRPGPPDAQSLAGSLREPLQKVGGGAQVIGPAGFDQGDGAGNGFAVRAPYPALQSFDVKGRHASLPTAASS